MKNKSSTKESRLGAWGQAGADALSDGGLDGHEGAKAGSVSWAENDTRQG